MFTGHDSQGDKTDIAGYFGALTPATDVPAISDAASTCTGGPPARALAVQVLLQARLRQLGAGGRSASTSAHGNYGGKTVIFAQNAEATVRAAAPIRSILTIQPSTAPSRIAIPQDAITPDQPNGPSPHELWR